MKEFHALYILVDLGCVLIPFLFSFHPALRFHKRWQNLIPGIAIMMLFFIPWDILFTSKGIWGFNSSFILGFKLAGLPIEEWLFFICIPYACLFTYHCMKYFFPVLPAPKVFSVLNWTCAVLFLVIAFSHTGKWYTFSAHLLAGLFLLFHLVVWRSKYLGWFMLTFLLIFPLFILSNGILTGVDFWHYPLINFNPENIVRSVVIYNNDHNLGIRIFSMPLDDIAYGMFMLLLVTTCYEKINVRKS